MYITLRRYIAFSTIIMNVFEKGTLLEKSRQTFTDYPPTQQFTMPNIVIFLCRRK